jgi:hypothetical protein
MPFLPHQGAAQSHHALYLHYTDPGDIVFDGFCGTGMTGVGCPTLR